MPQVTSADGTPIGYDQLSDNGPTVVLVSGGLDDGTENLPLGEHLATSFAVITYRRRGRGDSGETQPYSVQHEIEDPRPSSTRLVGWCICSAHRPVGHSP